MLSMWAGGIAGGAAAVAWWRIVGAGFAWLAAFVVLLFGVPAVAVGSGAGAVVGVALTVAATILGRPRPGLAAIAFGGAAIGFVAAAVVDGGVVLALTGALLLGATTSEMLLGHWYLVDPRLPRWALRRLDAAAVVGVVADAAVLVAGGALGWAAGDEVIGWTFIALAVFSAVLLVAVHFALREPSYTGVMAATGLSYLAVLTVFGVAVLGRALLDPSGVSIG